MGPGLGEMLEGMSELYPSICIEYHDRKWFLHVWDAFDNNVRNEKGADDLEKLVEEIIVECSRDLTPLVPCDGA